MSTDNTQHQAPTPSELPTKLREQNFYDADEQVLLASAEYIEQLERERNMWEEDARIMKANWDAACHDIDTLQKAQRPSIEPSIYATAIKTIAEWPITDERRNLDAVNMRRVAANALLLSAPSHVAAPNVLADKLDELIEGIDHMGTGGVETETRSEREWRELAAKIRTALSATLPTPSAEAVLEARRHLDYPELAVSKRISGLFASEIVRIAAMDSTAKEPK